MERRRLIRVKCGVKLFSRTMVLLDPVWLKRSAFHGSQSMNSARNQSGDGATAGKVIRELPEFGLNTQRAVDLWDVAQAMQNDVTRIRTLTPA